MHGYTVKTNYYALSVCMLNETHAVQFWCRRVWNGGKILYTVLQRMNISALCCSSAGHDLMLCWRDAQNAFSCCASLPHPASPPSYPPPPVTRPCLTPSHPEHLYPPLLPFNPPCLSPFFPGTSHPITLQALQYWHIQPSHLPKAPPCLCPSLPWYFPFLGLPSPRQLFILPYMKISLHKIPLMSPSNFVSIDQIKIKEVLKKNTTKSKTEYHVLSMQR